MSVALGISADKYVLIKTTGNVNLGHNSKCDSSGIFFVGGDLNISPNFTNKNENSSCLFFVYENINFLTPTTYTTSGTTELVEALLISAKTTTVKIDSSGRPALLINGGLVSKKLDIKRDVFRTNKSIPAFSVKYDPRHKVKFQDLFYPNNYSIREY